jgi:hypothetical protein
MAVTSSDHGEFHDATSLCYIVVSIIAMLVESKMGQPTRRVTMRIMAACMTASLSALAYFYHQHKVHAVAGGAF